MQNTFNATPQSQPAGRVDTPPESRTTNTVQNAAQWLRQRGRDDDNFDGRQWWEESDSESDQEESPCRSPIVATSEPTSPKPSIRSPDDDLDVAPVQPQPAQYPTRNDSRYWQKYRANMMYEADPEEPTQEASVHYPHDALTINSVESQPDHSPPHSNPGYWKEYWSNEAYWESYQHLSIKPSPLKIVKKEKPVSGEAEPSSEPPVLKVDKPLPALPDMRVTGVMANGVKIISLAEAQAQLKARVDNAPAIDGIQAQRPIKVNVTPPAPARRRRILGLSKLTASSASSSGTSNTASNTHKTTPTAPVPAPPTSQAPIRVVGDPRRDTLWTDFMPSPTRPPPPPPTDERKCPCPEHRAERAAAYTIPRKPVPSEHSEMSEPLHSPSVQYEIDRLQDRVQLTYDPDDDYDREPVIDTFVRAGHTSLHIKERVDPHTMASHYGREERLDGDENVERAKAKMHAYHEARRLGVEPSPTTDFR